MDSEKLSTTGKSANKNSQIFITYLNLKVKLVMIKRNSNNKKFLILRKLHISIDLKNMFVYLHK